MLFKMLILGTAKVRLSFSIIQKAKIRYCWDFNLFKMPENILLGSNIAENAKIRHGWGLLLFKKQKLGTAGTLLYLKC